MADDKALDALLSQHEKHLTVLSDGRVKCELNGHTMPPRLDVVRAFVSGTKYQRLARAAEADASLEQYAPFIVPSLNFPQMLYCALTGQLIDRSLDAVRRHVKGKRWAGAKARFAEDRRGLRPEPSLSEFGVRLPGGKEDERRRKQAGSGSEEEGSEEAEEEEEDGEPMFAGVSGSSGSDEEEEEEDASGSGSDEDDEEMEESEEAEEAAPARGKAAAGKKQQQQQPRRQQGKAPPAKAATAVGKHKGAAAPAPPMPATPAAKGPGGKKRNPTRPSKAKKARA